MDDELDGIEWNGMVVEEEEDEFLFQDELFVTEKDLNRSFGMDPGHDGGTRFYRYMSLFLSLRYIFIFYCCIRDAGALQGLIYNFCTYIRLSVCLFRVFLRIGS